MGDTECESLDYRVPVVVVLVWPGDPPQNAVYSYTPSVLKEERIGDSNNPVINRCLTCEEL